MPLRFVDASVFVHAYLKPRRSLRPHEVLIKKHAKAIVTRINRGESVVTSTVHVAEIANLLEDWMDLRDAHTILIGLASMDNVKVLSVDRTDLIDAIVLASAGNNGTTDALAVVLMRREGPQEIYSFDRDYDRFEGIKRVAR